MVYCGKPSGACQPCREKKTRCDQRLPGCTQCERAKRICPGYRAPGDLLFRNESDNVIRKAKAKEARTKAASIQSVQKPAVIALPASSEESATECEETLEVVRSDEPTPRFLSLIPNIEDQATAFFVSNYAINISEASDENFDYMTLMYGNNSADVGLREGMKAVGLAGFAHASRSSSLMRNARYQYVKALQAVNAALKSPEHVKKDSTLTSIMVLSIFENLTGYNQKSLKAWSEHVNGAASLLKIRGIEQINTIVGRRLLAQVASSLIISCLSRELPIPSHVLEWSLAAREKFISPDRGYLAQYMMMEFTTLYAGVRDGSLSDPQEILTRALELDGRIVDMFKTDLPPGWEYETVYTDMNADWIYNGRYHIYGDHWIAQIWNGMRSTRIMLGEMIRDLLLAGFSSKPPLFTAPEYTAQFQASTDVIYAMQADILRTVPQHLGYVFPSNESQKNNDPQFQNRLVLRMSGAYFLMWPLWLAGIVDFATDEVKAFVATNLKTIGTRVGIQQAMVLADVVESKTGITPW